MEFFGGTDQVLRHLFNACDDSGDDSLFVYYEDNDVGFCDIDDAANVDRISDLRTLCIW